jgi:flagellin-like protein
MKSLRKSEKGVSDVIAVLLMIAIAVAASLIAYAWVMGYLGGVTGKVGNSIQIQSMANVGGSLTIYVQNIGTGPVTLSTVYVDGVQPTTAPAIAQPLLNATNTTSITTSFPAGYVSTEVVSVKVVCNDGTSAEASETVPSP